MKETKTHALLHLFFVAVFSLTAVSHAAPTNLMVYGSSVARGYSARDDFGAYTTNNGSLGLAYAGRLTTLLGRDGWYVTNSSTPGDNTALAIADFNSKVVSQSPDFVLIGLSLGNEGLHSTPRPDSAVNIFSNGMQELIGLCRTNDFYPIVTLVYPNNNFYERHYDRVKAMNLVMNTWDVPSFNLLGALDDGTGKWVDGYWKDPLHPNADGHLEFFCTFVPSLFDAINAGKTNSPDISSAVNFARATRDLTEPAQIEFVPSNTMHSFTTRFRVRTTDTGSVAAVRLAPPKILVDFGPNNDDDGRRASDPDENGNYWNSWRPIDGYTNLNYIVSGTSTSGLITSDNQSTEVGLEITENFTGANGIQNGGLDDPDGPQFSLLGDFAVETATEDYFYDGNTAAFKITGLNTGSLYTLRFFGTRAWSSETRETRYVAAGGNGPLTNDLVTSGNNVGSDGVYDGNDDTIVSITGLAATASGVITVRLSTVQGSYSYLGIMEIAQETPVVTNGYGTIEVRDTEIAYASPSGSEITASVDANDGSWYDIALSHRYAKQETLLYVDGAEAGTLSESIVPQAFVLGGPDAADGAPPSPSTADYQDWCVYRAAWTEAEALAQHEGHLQQASLEICAPLSDSTFPQGGRATNEAQSLSVVTINIDDLSATAAVTAPGNLQAASYALDEVELSWTDNSTTESGYVVERRISESGAMWTNIAALSAGSTSYKDSDVSAGITYDYRVSTDEGTVQSEYSNVVTIEPGEDGQTYQTWRNRFFLANAGRYLVDFNTLASPDYGGVIWNTATSLTAMISYDLTATNGDASAGYVLTITDAFDQFRSGNGSPLSGFDNDAQSTIFVTTNDTPKMGQVTLSGLNDRFIYDVTVFGRRGSLFAGYDYRARYNVSGRDGDISFEVNTATNEIASHVFGLRPRDGRIAIDVAAPDAPTGKVFAGVSLLAFEDMSPGNTFLIDFNDRAGVTYPDGQSWNVVTGPTAAATYNLVDVSGSAAEGFSLTMNDAFSDSRDKNGGAIGGFTEEAESVLFNLNGFGDTAQMTFSGLDVSLTYDFTFLASRRNPFASSYDYNARFVFTGGGDPVTSVVDSADNDYYTLIEGIQPDGGGDIVLTVDSPQDVGGKTEFPVLNLIRMTEESMSNTVQSASSDDPDGDGIANFVEYAHNFDPTNTGVNTFSVDQVGVEGGGTTFVGYYDRYKPAREITYGVESTTNLLAPDWQPDAGISLSVVSDAGTAQTIKLQRAVTETTLFIRVATEYTP
ncbi:MAG: hypothetical protein KJ626_14435 [Verrucomicrobia bacterium]|nr:hypothetical protein [Verrucomicrobiota bacterium]